MSRTRPYCVLRTSVRIDAHRSVCAGRVERGFCVVVRARRPPPPPQPTAGHRARYITRIILYCYYYYIIINYNLLLLDTIIICKYMHISIVSICGTIDTEKYLRKTRMRSRCSILQDNVMLYQYYNLCIYIYYCI